MDEVRVLVEGVTLTRNSGALGEGMLCYGRVWYGMLFYGIVR